MEKQNITISVEKKLLKKAKHIAIDRHTSLSGLLSEKLRELVESDESYSVAKNRQLNLLTTGMELGLEGKISWSRDELHER
jgi:hypothetical protein